MGVDEVVEQCPLQPGAQTPVDPESVARQLDAPGIVDQTQVRAEIHMVLRLKVEMVGLAVVADRLVVLLAAGLQVGIGQVGQAEHQRVVFLHHASQFPVDLADPGGKGLHLSQQGSGVLPGLLHGGDLLGGLVLLALEPLGLTDQRPAFGVQLQDAGHLVPDVLLLHGQAVDDLLRMLLDVFDVDHGVTPP